MSNQCGLEVIMFGRSLKGSLTILPCFLSGSLESQSLRNGFLSCSRLKDVSDFVSYPLMNFFRLGHDALCYMLPDRP